MTAVKSMLPDAISRWEVDLAVVNGENSAGTGFGITEDTYQGIRGAGARGHAGQSLLESQGSLELHRNRAAPGAATELRAGHARTGLCPGRDRGRQARAGAERSRA